MLCRTLFCLIHKQHTTEHKYRTVVKFVQDNQNFNNNIDQKKCRWMFSKTWWALGTTEIMFPLDCWSFLIWSTSIKVQGTTKVDHIIKKTPVCLLSCDVHTPRLWHAALCTAIYPSNTLNLSSASPLCPWGGTMLQPYPPATEVEDSAFVKHSPKDLKGTCYNRIIKRKFSCFVPLCEACSENWFVVVYSKSRKNN